MIHKLYVKCFVFNFSLFLIIFFLISDFLKFKKKNSHKRWATLGKNRQIFLKVPGQFLEIYRIFFEIQTEDYPWTPQSGSTKF